MDREVVTFIIPDKRKRYLLQLRDNKVGIPYPNTWVFPGGGREPNESFTQAVIREANEEFGINIEERELIELGSYLHDGQEDHIFYYEGPLTPKETSEGQRIQYASLRRISRIKLGFGQEKVIEFINKKNGK